jgi:Protein of unknown function (DUF2934)
MSTPRRRRNDQQPLNHVVGALATVPTATGDIPSPGESSAREPSHDEIARRAYQLFEERGGKPGHEWEDWFQAERDLRQRMFRDVVESAVATGGPYAAA